MREATADPTCWIVERPSPTSVVYENAGGERWVIEGVCVACGLCEVGSVNPNLRWVGEPGTPGACIDVTFGSRLDNPVRPEIAVKIPSCTLSGRYL